MEQVSQVERRVLTATSGAGCLVLRHTKGTQSQPTLEYGMIYLEPRVLEFIFTNIKTALHITEVTKGQCRKLPSYKIAAAATTKP